MATYSISVYQSIYSNLFAQISMKILFLIYEVNASYLLKQLLFVRRILMAPKGVHGEFCGVKLLKSFYEII